MKPTLVTYRKASGLTYKAIMTKIDNVTGDGTISSVYISTAPYERVEYLCRKYDDFHTAPYLRVSTEGWVSIDNIVEPLCNKCGSLLEMETSGGGYTDMGDPQPQEVDWVCPNCDDDMEEF